MIKVEKIRFRSGLVVSEDPPAEIVEEIVSLPTVRLYGLLGVIVTELQKRKDVLDELGSRDKVAK